MSILLDKIEHDILNLSLQERAFLADRLLSSLDENMINDVDKAWIAEAERRYQEYQAGGRKGFTAKEVFATADRILS